MAREKDVVLIYFEDNPVGFARIEEILPDSKKDWYHVKLLLLQLPLQTVTWILRDVYIDGEEFTMNGNRMRIEEVVCPEAPETLVDKEDTEGMEETEEGSPAPGQPPDAKVISLSDRKPGKI